MIGELKIFKQVSEYLSRDFGRMHDDECDCVCGEEYSCLKKCTHDQQP